MNISGIVTGGLLVRCLVVTGELTLFASAPMPMLRGPVAMLACFYLVNLGLGTIFQQPNTEQKNKTYEKSPSGGFALACFQFATPKTWILVTAASSAIGASKNLSNFMLLMIILLLIPIFSLLLWSILGKSIHSLLHSDLAHQHFQQISGLLLVTTALSLFLSIF